MAKRKGVAMWERREVLRLSEELKRSNREIAKSLGIGRSTVNDIVARAKAADVTWEKARDLDEGQLMHLLYGADGAQREKEAPLPDFVYIHKELKRKGVTRSLLWLEYREQYPEGYGYSQFCEYYRRWLKKSDVCLRQEYKAGEKMFVDFSGDKPSYTDPKTGERVECDLFVAVLGASNFTYAEATPSQELVYWIECHTNALEHFQGAPAVTVPDNTKTAVTKPCWYEPVLNRTYKDWAEHYGTVVIPARIRRPKDKAKVESGVRIAQTWILARLRNRKLFSLQELNRAIQALLKELNDRELQGLGMSRRELYRATDKLALRSLSDRRFEVTEWKDARVNIDYHVAFDKHFYSVPYNLVQEKVAIRASHRTVEVFFKGKRVASHVRLYGRRQSSTVEEHMPKKHREYLKWTPSRILDWAAKTGPNAKALVEEILNAQKHPELGYRRCLGILRLGQKYGQDRLEAACVRALASGTKSYQSVKNILEIGLDRKVFVVETRRSQGDHRNVRGQAYFK